jgi:hypothetical protein
MKLDYHIWKSAVNGYLAFHIDPKPRPTFFNIADAYPELDLITQAYPAIRAEFDQLMAAGERCTASARDYVALAGLLLGFSEWIIPSFLLLGSLSYRNLKCSAK